MFQDNEETSTIIRRKRMVRILSESPLNFDKTVLAAIERVPRHLFCSSTFLALAYDDRTIPIECGQTLSQPSTVARELSLLEIKPNDKVLEIGTGSGYQTACLSLLCSNLYSIERQENLYKETTKLLSRLGVKANLRLGDGYKGISEEAPFDKIVVTAASFGIPKELIAQLKIGGIAVIPIEINEATNFYKLTRKNEKDFDVCRLESCCFVPMMSGTSRRE